MVLVCNKSERSLGLEVRLFETYLLSISAEVCLEPDSFLLPLVLRSVSDTTRNRRASWYGDCRVVVMDDSLIPTP
ncbi:hypothetical protein DPMN_062573 [Dreissena polymorpha]|uniref:Uncharacterized protein n=1 Tax=Dreissena polymorpha TaxID=45954 RepID=A0A9D4HKA7_DREPO|nr:hypothetical protein DPMN_062573 [Dreissena polymorpha]